MERGSRVATAEEDGTRGELSLKTGPRELEALRLRSQGHSVKEVAVLMGVSYHTTKERLAIVRRKLGARNTAHAVTIAIGRGLI